MALCDWTPLQAAEMGTYLAQPAAKHNHYSYNRAKDIRIQAISLPIEGCQPIGIRSITW